MDPDDPAWPSFVADTVAWAEQQYAEIASEGVPLSPDQMELARCARVEHPERIRVQYVSSIPAPADAEVQRACESVHFLGDHAVALTLSYGIYMRRAEKGNRFVLAHECQHVAQYEHCGSIEAFLRMYLRQLVLHGYTDAPLEVKAQEVARSCT